MVRPARLLAACAALALASAYIFRVFHLQDGQFRVAGLGDWMDPYFINALLEHWYRSARTLADPSSPSMYFPARHVLGYSHGLVLYAPFYIPLRVFLHPFQAYNLTIFLVMDAGVLCLYLLFRRVGVSFVESLVLCAFFLTSHNVVNGPTGVWTQRASVFLIPPIALMAFASAQMRPGRWRVVLAGLSGLLATLMYVQDFYSAHFAALFVTFFVLAAIAVERGAAVRGAAASGWASRPRGTRVALVVLVAAAIVAGYIFMYGGGGVRVLGVRLAARDWRRPAVVALLAAGLWLWQDAGARRRIRDTASTPWIAAFTTGALLGAAVFAWMYVGSFREHQAFPRQEVWDQLAVRNAYASYRSFILVVVLALAAWIPWFGVSGKGRRYLLWLAAVSAFVAVAPLKVSGFSAWMAFVARLPGFAVIRDPKRIIYLYELAVVCAMAPILARAASRRYRMLAAVCMAVLIAASGNTEVFDYERPDAPYDRWVAAPIAIDPSCRSFFIKGASAEYMSRSSHMWTLYGIDSMFVSFDHAIPTINGYSAWSPDGWELWNPQEASYPGRVKRWVDSHGLVGVCELDIDGRSMKPWSR